MLTAKNIIKKSRYIFYNSPYTKTLMYVMQEINVSPTMLRRTLAGVRRRHACIDFKFIYLFARWCINVYLPTFIIINIIWYLSRIFPNTPRNYTFCYLLKKVIEILSTGTAIVIYSFYVKYCSVLTNAVLEYLYLNRESFLK